MRAVACGMFIVVVLGGTTTTTLPGMAIPSPSIMVSAVSWSRRTIPPQQQQLQLRLRGGANQDEQHDTSSSSSSSRPLHVLVVGSLNADTFLPVDRLPVEGENLVCLQDPTVDVPGGKGCTQAVAAAKLLLLQSQQGGDDPNNNNSHNSHHHRVSFCGHVGGDAAGRILLNALQEAGINTTACGVHGDSASGRGYVFLSQSTGQVSAVVSSGSNDAGWGPEWHDAFAILQQQQRQQQQNKNNDAADAADAAFEAADNLPASVVRLYEWMDALLDSVSCLLLQCEIPDHVNQVWAARAANHECLIFQDVGGSDRPLSRDHLRHCHYLTPNETELRRLVRTLQQQQQQQHNSSPEVDDHRHPNFGKDDSDLVSLARYLQRVHGARHVLVTQGSRGSTLVSADDGPVIFQPPVNNNIVVVDETGAGDCYRAAWAVARCLENHTIPEIMMFASAAGSLAVETFGAVPSTPTRQAVQERYQQQQQQQSTVAPSVLNIPSGGGSGWFWKSWQRTTTTPTPPPPPPTRTVDYHSDSFPFMIGSRLNSMKDRPELWSDGPLQSPRDWVLRQATVRGLTCVDFNYPQHFNQWWNVSQAAATLRECGLTAGAVCLRYPSSMARGAMNHPSATVREEALKMTLAAAATAEQLGCREVVVWSAFDGYDYPFQVDYDTKWQELVDAFRDCCDAYPAIRFSVEYKPTDENTRFFTIPSTGAGILMVQEVNRPNFGLTLDVGHMLMTGENPGQSIAMVGRAIPGKLFGVQLNDGFTRLAAEDGLMFGSVHPGMALEIMYQLRRVRFDGHVYFDTFPQRTDPVAEAEYNIERVKGFWKVASELDETELARIVQDHDAVGALRLVDQALAAMGALEASASSSSAESKDC